jgi:CRISPR-associated protein Cmr3
VATKHRYVLPQEENRTHVGIDPKTGRAIDGRLFRTMGLDFGPVTRSGDDGQWAFVGQGPVGLEPGLVVFGGERRLSGLENEAAGIWALPDALRTPLLHASGFALTLATPALFEGGWRPGWLDVDGTGMVPGSALRVRLRAALVDRWQPVSGWDLRNQKPKAMRRAIAAGSTYWFEIIEGQLDPAALWLSAVSDQVQDRLDGFGLSLLRPWAVLS